MVAVKSLTVAVDIKLTQSYVAVLGELLGPLSHGFVDTRTSRTT